MSSMYSSINIKGRVPWDFFIYIFASISFIWTPDSLAASFSKMSQNSQSYSNFKICPVESHNADLKQVVRKNGFEQIFWKATGVNCIAGKRTWLYCLPQSQKKQCILYIVRRTAIVWNMRKFIAVCQVWAWWPIASTELTVHFQSSIR